MSRLTKRNPDGSIGISQCKYYNYEDFQKIANKLAMYEDLEEQGMLVKLPCKAGNKLYDIRQNDVHCRRNDIVHELTICGPIVKLVPWETWMAKDIDLEDIGKTVFLTREDAEQELKRLKEMEGAE